MQPSFREFFGNATKSVSHPQGSKPYPYQEMFATAAELPHLVRAPTGAGKTATAILGWLYRWRTNSAGTPRRLVYCLPMRVLVEQSRKEAETWIAALREAKAIPEVIPVHVLMGGVDTAEWFLHPEKPAVLIGTQDMLLSRALNRGFAATRFHWPIDFGLLNNDCLWVFDEPQLMANGVSTSSQLAGLRKQLDTFGTCPSVWMSATLEPGWLDTVDFRGRFPSPPLELTAADDDPALPLHKRMTAAKVLDRLDAEATKDGKPVAKAVWSLHERGTQTLVVLNTVERAKAVYAEIEKLRKKEVTPKLLLVHSRFRPAERKQLNATLTDKEAATDRIIVATQVVEAGVDITSRTLVTELAPWPSVVQRIGRCNRAGDDGSSQDPARVRWIDLDAKLALPYTEDDLAFARVQLNKLGGKEVSPKALEDFKRIEGIVLPFEHTHVVRRRDVIDLFDTAPDLSGNDIDISRFVRSDDKDTDVQVFWRVVGAGGPDNEEPQPIRRELCSVPVGQARDFLKALAEKKRGAGYVWDHIEEQWGKLDLSRLRPGLQILLPTTAGGYSILGWDRDATTPVVPLPPDENGMKRGEGIGSDANSETAVPYTIAQHTNNVCDELDALLAALGPLPDGWDGHLRTAARWHDVGKGHWAFQQGMRTANPALDPSQLWAKSGKKGRLRHGQPYFRHELASALAALQNGLLFEAAYLAGSHHGMNRLGIRAHPKETPFDDPGEPYACGVRDKDKLPPVDIGEESLSPETVLSLLPMRLGGPESWTARALALLDKLGPFQLAYLESLLRAADVRASQKEAGRG